MPTPMKYTFILTAYKRTYLKEAIESILSQTFKSFLLIIINDHSPYDLDSVVAQFSNSRISYHSLEQNRGGTDLVGHWNKCLEYAKTPYVIFASDDDLYAPDFLEKIDVLTIKYPNVDIFTGRSNHICNGTITAEDVPVTKQHMTCMEFIDIYSQGKLFSGLQNHVFRRSALIGIGGLVNFPLAWFSDDATVLSLSINGIAYTNDIVFSFRFSDENISSISSDSQTLGKQIKANDMYYKWIDSDFRGRMSHFDDQNIQNASSKLKKYIASAIKRYVFGSSFGTIWNNRSVIYNTRFLGKWGGWKLIALVFYKNYKYTLNLSKWPYYISKLVNKH